MRIEDIGFSWWCVSDGGWFRVRGAGGWRLRRSYDRVREMASGDELGLASAGAGRGMRLLVLDTCGTDGSMVLVEAGDAAGLEGAPVRLDGGPTIVATATFPGRSSSERLLPELRAMLGATGWRLGELAAIGVVSGPGSFTGVRVGVAAAKGMCEGAGVPLVMVSRLAVLAEKAGGRDVMGEDGSREYGVGQALLDAGRGEVFYGRFETGAAAPIEALLAREEVLAEVRSRGRVGVGRVAVCEEEVRTAFAELDPVMVGPLSAADAVPLVVARVGRGAFDDVAAADGNYLRRTDLEMLARLGQRSAG